MDILFGKLFRLYYNDMVFIAAHILRDRFLAEDVSQEAFIRIYRHLEQIPDLELEIYRRVLVRITRNIATDYYRKRKREPEVSYDLLAPIIRDESDVLEYLERKSSEKEIYKRLLVRMKPIHLNILIQKYYYEMTDKESAQVLHISNDAVRTRLVRARRELRKIGWRDI